MASLGPCTFVAALLVAAGSHAAAQVQLPEGVSLRISGRLNVQFNTTSVDSAAGEALPGNEFMIRRARLTFDVRVGDFLSARFEPEYSYLAGAGNNGVYTLRDAYVRGTFTPAFRITAGQFKRPFDVFELTSSTQILVIERTGFVRGVAACGALPSVCSYSALTEGLLYSDRDLGIMADGELGGGTFRYAVALTNGRAQNVREDNSNKSYTARVSVRPVTDVVVSVNGAYKDFTHPTSEIARFAKAWGADAEVGNFTRGVHVQAGITGGDDWRVATGPQEVATFLTTQVIATYRAPVHHKWLKGLEPVVRASWADPDTDTDGDDGWLLTPGLNVHLGGRNMLMTNLDVWDPATGTTEYSFKMQWNFHF